MNSIADPEIATALQTLLTWANGNVDAANIKSPPVLVAGSWQPLTMATNWTTGANLGAGQASARQEGDLLRLRGFLQNNTGSTVSSGTIATYPGGLTGTTSFAVVWGGTAGLGTISLAGTTIQPNGLSVPNGAIVRLDGLSSPMT